MVDTTLLVIAGVALVLSVATIVSVEFWDRISPVLARWGWLIAGVLAAGMVWTAADAWRRDERWNVLIFLASAIMFLWHAISDWQRRPPPTGDRVR